MSKEEQELLIKINTKKMEMDDLIQILRCGMQSKPINQRWVNIGQTQIQLGFMALTKSIYDPETF